MAALLVSATGLLGGLTWWWWPKPAASASRAAGAGHRRRRPWVAAARVQGERQAIGARHPDAAGTLAASRPGTVPDDTHAVGTQILHGVDAPHYVLRRTDCRGWVRERADAAMQDPGASER